MGDQMAYRISYDNGTTSKWNEKQSSQKKRIFLRLLVVVLICVLGVSFLGGTMDALLEFLIPGDPDVTKQAISKMVEEIKSGNSLKEAITTFCKGIVENANNQG